MIHVGKLIEIVLDAGGSNKQGAITSTIVHISIAIFKGDPVDYQPTVSASSSKNCRYYIRKSSGLVSDVSLTYGGTLHYDKSGSGEREYECTLSCSRPCVASRPLLTREISEPRCVGLLRLS